MIQVESSVNIVKDVKWFVGGYRFRAPLLVTIEQDGEQFIATDLRTDRYAEASTSDDALEELAYRMVAYYRTLHERRERLSPRLSRHYDSLRQVIDSPT